MKLYQQMPKFTQTIVMPEYTMTGSISTIVLRYYTPWGDGSPEGWKTPVEPAVVMVNQEKINTRYVFGFTGEDYVGGQGGPGYDQHAQYYAAIPEVTLKPGDEIFISGEFQKCAYCSVSIYFNNQNSSIESIDFEFQTDPSNTNPYIKGNPSVFSYENTVSKYIRNHEKSKLAAYPQRECILDVPLRSEPDTGEIYFYRLDHGTSEAWMADEINSDGCSEGYLCAQNNAYEIMIMRYKLPDTFMHNDTPDLVFGDYQCREFSACSQISTNDMPVFDFWCVNSRMLNEMKDDDGYVYVFYAANEFVQSLMSDMPADSTTPPILQWGNYKGYVLGDPTYCILLRYRVPNPDWIGNPASSTCYDTMSSSLPLEKGELGVYTPEMYGDTLENYNKGHIGLVYSNLNWPE